MPSAYRDMTTTDAEGANRWKAWLLPACFWVIGPLLGAAFSWNHGWTPSEESPFFEVCALIEPLIGLAVFVELVLVLGPLVKDQGETVANQQLARAVVRTNAGLILISQGASMYAVADESSSVFLLFAAVTPMVLQMFLLVDCAYQRVGINRIRQG